MAEKGFLELYPERYDPSRAFLEVFPKMVRMARRAARNEAISYRNVHVGAAGKFYDSDTFAEAILSGANVKLNPSYRKYCAEMDVIDQARELGYSNATGIVIAGPSNPRVVESISGTATPTLHPCVDCRAKITENKDIITDDTLIVTVSTEENVFQVHWANELSMLYEAAETRETMFLESALPLSFEDWTGRVGLYDTLRSGNREGVSSQLLAKIALENVVDLDTGY